MEQVEAFGATHGIPETATYQVNVEIDELLTNYVMHRPASDVPPIMVVRIRLIEQCLVLMLSDTGPPFDPRSGPKYEPGTDRVGGAGLHLVQSFADRLEYREVEGTNVLRLEHDLGPHPEARD